MAGSAPSPWPAHMGMNFTRTIHEKRNPSIDPANVTLPDGYTVAVTGAGKRGNGESIAKAYVQAKAQSLIITSRTQSDLDRVRNELEEIAAKQSRKINLTTCVADATKLEDYQKIRDTIERLYEGRLDCLVLNAGAADMTGADGPFHEIDLKIFNTATTLNYIGPYYGAMVLIPLLLNSRSSGKTLINIVSAGAHLVDMPSQAYNVAKLASIRMTEVYAALYTKDGLRCFALHPGAVPTPGALESVPGVEKWLNDDVGLAGDTCVWLSNERPTWASGRYIAATWDIDEFKAMREEIVAGDKLKFRMVV